MAIQKGPYDPMEVQTEIVETEIKSGASQVHRDRMADPQVAWLRQRNAPTSGTLKSWIARAKYSEAKASSTSFQTPSFFN